MPKIDTSLWNNVRRLRERVRNLATMVLTCSVIGLYSAIATKNWLVITILGLYFITTLPVFISYAKWQKSPPPESEESCFAPNVANKNPPGEIINE